MHTARLLAVAGGGSAFSRGGGACYLGVCYGGLPGLGEGAVVSQYALSQTPPVNRITDSCKNITFLQLCLRAVTRRPFNRTGPGKGGG